MITSKLTSKAQTTIPQAVRSALKLDVGDEIAYLLRDDEVVIQKVVRSAVEDPFATFSEWDSEADRTAYANL